MQQVEVDVVAAQAAQALPQERSTRIAAGQAPGALAHAELGGDHDVIAARAEASPKSVSEAPSP